MAFDLLTWKQSGKNFARGSPPPAHSHEWVGVELPPEAKATIIERRATFEKRGGKWYKVEEVDAPPPPQERASGGNPKMRLWPYLLGATAVVLGLSYVSKRGQREIHERVRGEHAFGL